MEACQLIGYQNLVKLKALELILNSIWSFPYQISLQNWKTCQITAGVAGRKNPLQITSDLQRVFLPGGLATIAMWECLLCSFGQKQKVNIANITMTVTRKTWYKVGPLHIVICKLVLLKINSLITSISIWELQKTA